MEKLSSDTQKIISFAVKYCGLVDINSLLIDKNGIRAKQDEKAVYLIEPGDYSFLEFDTLYIDRISSLAPRIKMFETSKIDYVIKADIKTLSDNTKVVRNLVIKSDKTQLNFKTSMLTSGLNIPKAIKDPEYYSFKMNAQDLSILKKGISAMGAQTFNLYTDDDKIYCDIKDLEGDEFKQELSEEYETLHEDAPDNFETPFNFKIIFPLLQEAGRSEGEFEATLTRKGIMGLVINGLSMYVFPEVD